MKAVRLISIIDKELIKVDNSLRKNGADINVLMGRRKDLLNRKDIAKSHLFKF